MTVQAKNKPSFEHNRSVFQIQTKKLTTKISDENENLNQKYKAKREILSSTVD